MLDGNTLLQIDRVDWVYLTLSCRAWVGGQVVSFPTAHEHNPIPRRCRWSGGGRRSARRFCPSPRPTTSAIKEGVPSGAVEPGQPGCHHPGTIPEQGNKTHNSPAWPR